MARTYRKTKRADAQEETREKIVRATMALHLEQGVATTSFLDVAARAGVGAATVYRHFPTTGSLVEACGAHIWQAINPPRPEQAKALFAGCRSRPARVRRLVSELDAFYARASAPLWSAIMDRDRIPELALFLKRVTAGITAWVAEALDEEPHTSGVKIVTAVTDFTTWLNLSDAGVDREELTRLMVAMIDAAIAANRPAASKSMRTGRLATPK
jgi:AcrR family transcriptional regulator